MHSPPHTQGFSSGSQDAAQACRRCMAQPDAIASAAPLTAAAVHASHVHAARPGLPGALHPPGCFATPPPTPAGATWSNQGSLGSACSEPPLSSAGRLDMLPRVATCWPAPQGCRACQAGQEVGPNSRACQAWDAVIAPSSTVTPLLRGARELSGQVGAGRGASAAGRWPLVTRAG